MISWILRETGPCSHIYPIVGHKYTLSAWINNLATQIDGGHNCLFLYLNTFTYHDVCMWP